MASRARAGNLPCMTTTAAPCVRDDTPPYGPHEVDADEFPAAAVLEDLARAPDEDVPGILARYAALRSWLLREAGADPVLVRHAAEAAALYLAAVPDGPEAAALRGLAHRRPGLDGVRDAARAAEAAGHTEGACALYRAGYMTARRRGELAWAGHLAAALAELLGREGMDGAALWARRAGRLRKLTDRS